MGQPAIVHRAIKGTELYLKGFATRRRTAVMFRAVDGLNRKGEIEEIETESDVFGPVRPHSVALEMGTWRVVVVVL